MAEESLRDSLSSAFDKSEAGSTGAPPAPAPPAAPATPEGSPAPTTTGAPASGRDAQGRYLARTPTEPAAPTSPTTSTGAAPGAPPVPPVDPPIPVPRTWKPEYREKWGTLPREVQNEVIRRETEIQQGLQRAADARKFQEQFNQLITPYQAYFDIDRMSPMDGFKEYLTTTALLRSGTPQQKAVALANVISHFGVDVQMLDQYLAATIQGRNINPQPQQQFQDPRVDQILQHLQRQESQGQQYMENSLNQEISAFQNDPKNEFFEDLREDIADLLEMSANRGRTMTLAQAYERACEMNPDVRKVIEARRIAAARNSASSLRPGGAPPAASAGANGKGPNLRDAIDQAWNQHS